MCTSNIEWLLQALLLVKNLGLPIQFLQDFTAPEVKFSKNFGAVAPLPPLL